MAETICHFEIVSADPGRSREFYSRIFNWSFDDSGMPGYNLIRTGGEPSGGLFAKPAEMPTPAMNIYMLVDSIDRTLSKVREAGGNVTNEKTPIPGMGHWAMFQDPDGIRIGLFEPAQK